MAHVRQRRPSHGTSTTTTVAGSMRTGDVAGPLGQRPARRPMVRRSPTYAAVDHESRVVAHVNADVPVALLPQVGTHTPLRYFFSVCVCPRLAPPDRSGAAARTTQLIARKYVPAQASCSRIQGFSAARPLSVEDCGPDAALLHSRRALRRPPALVPPWPLCTRSSQAPSPRGHYASALRVDTDDPLSPSSTDSFSGMHNHHRRHGDQPTLRCQERGDWGRPALNLAAQRGYAGGSRARRSGVCAAWVRPLTDWACGGVGVSAAESLPSLSPSVVGAASRGSLCEFSLRSTSVTLPGVLVWARVWVRCVVKIAP